MAMDSSASAPSFTFISSNPNPNPKMQNPLSYSSSDLSSTISSLNNLIHLSQHIFHSLPTLQPPPQNPNPNLIRCPFNPHHLMPPESLFLHYLRCPSSPHPLHNPTELLQSLSYPKTLRSSHHSREDDRFVRTQHNPQAELCFSLDDYVDFHSNFFYRDCPGVVSLSDADSLKRTFSFPAVLSIECVDFIPCSDREITYCEREHVRILPSEYWTIRNEVEPWNDYPTSYSYGVVMAIVGAGVAKECDLMRWIIANSPRYGVVIDIAMQQHIFVLFSLCLKSILREALNTMDVLLNKQNLGLNWVHMKTECPILVQALTWLTSQISILYGATNGKLFVLNLIKTCILDGASGLLLFTSGERDVEASPLNAKFENSNVNIMDTKDANLDSLQKGNTNCRQNNIVDGTVCRRNISTSKVAAAVAALHERSLLEDRIKRLWFSQQPNKYQLVAEHCYVTERANEERKKRPDYKPIIDYDGLPRHQSSNMEQGKAKTREELLAEERDYKRRRMSYRGKKIKRSTVQVMRDIIEEYMEEITQAGGCGNPPNEPEESGKNLRKGSHESPSIAAYNPSHYEQQSYSSDCKKGRPDDAHQDTSIRDHEQPRQGHYRNHGYLDDQRKSSRGDYDREFASRSHERPKSRNRPNESSSRHKYHDYSNRKDYDYKLRSRDSSRRNSQRNRDYVSPSKSAFNDRYDPSESLDTYDDE